MGDAVDWLELFRGDQHVLPRGLLMTTGLGGASVGFRRLMRSAATKAELLTSIRRETGC